MNFNKGPKKVPINLDQEPQQGADKKLTLRKPEKVRERDPRLKLISLINARGNLHKKVLMDAVNNKKDIKEALRIIEDDIEAFNDTHKDVINSFFQYTKMSKEEKNEKGFITQYGGFNENNVLYKDSFVINTYLTFMELGDNIYDTFESDVILLVKMNKDGRIMAELHYHPGSQKEFIRQFLQDQVNEFEQKKKIEEDEEKRQKEIRKINAVLPEGGGFGSARYLKFRAPLYYLVEIGFLELDELPSWVGDNVTADSLFNSGFRAKQLKKEVAAWTIFIKKCIKKHIL